MRPKILCITSHDLDAPEYGGAIRAKNIFRLLEKTGDVSVALAGAYDQNAGNGKSSIGGFKLVGDAKFRPTQKPSVFADLRNEFDPRFLGTHGLQADDAGRGRMSALIAAHDLVWIHGLRVANGLGIFHWPHSVLDIDDIPSSIERGKLAQTRNVSGKLRHARQILAWRRREKILLERFDSVCVCSEPDRLKLGGGQGIFVVPNGFTICPENFRRRPASPPRIGFVGTLNYRHNRDGLHWFLKRVWPLILKAAPQTRLRVAGEGGEKMPWREFLNLDYLGWIADVKSEMAEWSLSIVPLLVGGGTRIKIAEAFSRRCPVVSTSVGAHGYDVRDGYEILIADKPEDFASKCLRALRNPAESQAITENAHKKFLANWTWDSIGHRVAKAAESVLRKK